MAERQPFVYPDWCTGPVVDIEMPTGFPVCDLVTFTRPTYLHVVRKDPPDIDPPPFCPCMPTIYPTSSATWEFGGTRSILDIKIVPINDDCCAPVFKLTFDIEVPCMPFGLDAVATFTSGETYADHPYFHITHPSGTCQFNFTLKLPPPGADIELCLYEHGEGVQFVPCCEGAGYIGLDATMEKRPSGQVRIMLFHHVNLKIPLLAKMAPYVTSVCDECLDPAKNIVYNPWGQGAGWGGSSNAAGTEAEKYCVKPKKIIS